MDLKVPWEATLVEKSTLGQAARKAAVGTKKAVAGKTRGTTATKAVPPAPNVTRGQKNRAAKVKVSWATREPGNLGPHLSMENQGFKMLTAGDGGGGKSLIPTRTLSGAGGAPKTGGAPKKKGGWVAPAAAATAATVTTGAAGYGLVKQGKKNKSVSKGLTALLGKPMKKPGGTLKPVQPPKPAMGVKPVTAPTGAKPMTAPKAPTPVTTLRPPSMMPPKPGMANKPAQPARPR